MFETFSVKVLEVTNYSFAGAFTAEAMMKLTAFGGQYFIDKWNIFDFM